MSDVLDFKTQMELLRQKRASSNNNSSEANKKSYIKYKGMPEVILTLTTQNNNLYNIGVKTRLISIIKTNLPIG